MKKIIIFTTIVVIYAGCSDFKYLKTGEEGSDCYDNGKCKDSLICVEGKCVKPGEAENDSDSDTGNSGNTGDSGNTGNSGYNYDFSGKWALQVIETWNSVFSSSEAVADDLQLNSSKQFVALMEMNV